VDSFGEIDDLSVLGQSIIIFCANWFFVIELKSNLLLFFLVNNLVMICKTLIKYRQCMFRDHKM
jgi:hypothetical protein